MDKNSVQSVERTFSIIEELSKMPEGVYLTDLSASTGLNKSTVHRLLGSLIQMGYASKAGETGKYFLTLKMFETGSRMIHKMDLLTTARHYLENLSAVTGEAVHLVVRSGNDIVYIFKEDSGNNSVRMSSRVGMRSPMYCTAVGKAMLADLPQDEVRLVWETSLIVRRTEKTILSLNELESQLQEVRRKGFAVDDEENETGVRCIGASVTGFYGKVIGAFSVSAPIGRMDHERLVAIAELVLKTKRDICGCFQSAPNPGV